MLLGRALLGQPGATGAALSDFDGGTVILLAGLGEGLLGRAQRC